jgi:hypothetical protein
LDITDFSGNLWHSQILSWQMDYRFNLAINRGALATRITL